MRMVRWSFSLLVLTLIVTLTSSQTVPVNQTITPTDGYTKSLTNQVLSSIRERVRDARRLIASQVSNALNSTQVQAYNIFLRLYNKTYPAQELQRRMGLFFMRRREIQNSVQMFRNGLLTFTMKENSFLDWDENELRRLTGVSVPSQQELDSELVETSVLSLKRRVTRSADETKMIVRRAETLPEHVDWRLTGCVSTPIDQKKCGACYAIATISVVETMRCLNNVSSPSLSSQQIVDCATRRAGYNNYGCDGGWPTRALKYLQDVGMAARDFCYPFQWRQQSCKMRSVKSIEGCAVSASSSGKKLKFKVLNNERDILYHVAKNGPVITVMKATDKFLYFGQGIFDDPKCSNRPRDTDHAIVIVGYGRENNLDYWIIKNSWGTTDWGEGGYAKYRRGKNACSIGYRAWAIIN